MNPISVRTALALCIFLPAGLVGTPAKAAPPADSGSWSEDRDPALGPAPDREHVRRINRHFRGLGIGYANGLWGRSFAQGLQIDVPFGRRVGQFFGMRLRGLWVHAHSESMSGESYDPVGIAGLELFGRTPVMLGVLRLYGGGGLYFGGRPFVTEGDRYRFGGGGHFGLEGVVSPRMSFTFEVGGQSATHGLGHDAGPSVMGGMMFYLGALGRKGR